MTKRSSGEMSEPAAGRFSDHFSQVATDYSAFRPSYPGEMFDFLAGLVPRRVLAWDCAAGSGQATVGLAPRFQRVIATDASAAQLAAAPSLANVQYRLARADNSGLDTGSVDLTIVAQAIHWLDLDRFYAEARRVLVPGGVLAVWCYGTQRTGERPLDTLLDHFYDDVIGPYWPPERRLVETGYRTIPFPFTEIMPPAFEMTAQWSLASLLGYLGTWSATSRYRSERGEDPIPELAAELSTRWGAADETKRIVWPLSMRVGRANVSDRLAA